MKRRMLTKVIAGTAATAALTTGAVLLTESPAKADTCGTVINLEIGQHSDNDILQICV